MMYVCYDDYSQVAQTVLTQYQFGRTVAEDAASVGDVKILEVLCDALPSLLHEPSRVRQEDMV
jgi:hypothetical protein